MYDIEVSPCHDHDGKVEVYALTKQGKKWIDGFASDADGRIFITSKNIQMLRREVNSEGLTLRANKTNQLRVKAPCITRGAITHTGDNHEN